MRRARRSAQDRRERSQGGRGHDDRDPKRGVHRLDGDPQRGRQDVVRAGEGEHDHERQPGDPHPRPPGGVARPGEQVMRGVSAEPTTIRSVRPGPGKSVCFWRQTSARCADISPINRAGRIMMWKISSRDRKSGVGDSPPNSRNAIQVPTNGIESTTEYAIRTPVPDKRSSGREYPVKPAPIPVTSIESPMSQLMSRGFRNAPVKKTRSRCATIASTKTTAAQWWICRTTRPARTSNESCITESNAPETIWPCRGAYGPS